MAWKDFRKITIAVILLLIMSFLIDRFLGVINKCLFEHAQYGIIGRQNYCLNQSNDKVFFLGSSRVSNQYVTSIFEDKLGTTCYNCGSEGMTIFYHYAILASNIERGHIPEMVVLDLFVEDIVENDLQYHNLESSLNRLAPYYNKYKSIDSLFLLSGNIWDRLKMQSICYRYNSMFPQEIKCNYIPQNEDKGYEEAPFHILSDTTLKTEVFDERRIDMQKQQYLYKIIKLAKDHKINLVVVHSPMYMIKNSEGMNEVWRITKEEGINAIDCSNEKQFMRPDFFRDNLHLNNEGAKAWSNYLAERLKSIRN